LLLLYAFRIIAHSISLKELIKMSEKARSRRQNLVRESIYDSALTLFAKNGFDDTTLEEVAQAAGISRRSFFRYFASKDDLLARSVVDYGKVLTEAIAACPPSLTPFQVVQVTVMTGVRHNVAQPNLREIINIASHSTNAGIRIALERG
jgi:AcrR family transcriptional regulator